MGNNEDLLKFVIENDMINLSYVQDKMNMKKKEEILSKHEYKIWQGANGYWYTKFPDDNGNYTKLKKRKSEELIKEDIVNYWKKTTENPTVEELFKEWVDGKLRREEIEPATKNRYYSQFNQCFGAIRNKRIRNIKEFDIEEFMLDAIHDNELTQKAFSNMRTLVYGIFKLAKKKKYVSYSITEIVRDIEISRKNFKHVQKNSEDEVFTDEELPVITNYLNENLDLVNLGILLMFKTGMRIGELVSLKKEDISDYNKIYIHRTEVKYKNEEGKMCYEVRDFPKTETSIRVILLPDKYKWILKRIHMMNPFGEYVFERNGKRMRNYIFRNRLRTVCDRCHIKPKSLHKIRKTYGTILIDNNVEESLILSQMGHKDISTTYKHYYRDMKNQTEKQIKINEIVGL